MVAFTATHILAGPLALIAVGVMAISWKFFPRPEKFALVPTRFRQLIMSTDPNVKPLIQRFGKACLHNAHLMLHHIRPGILQSKMRKIIIEDMKNEELKKSLEDVLEDAPGDYLSFKPGDEGAYLDLYRKARHFDDLFSRPGDEDKKATRVNILKDKWNQIIQKRVDNPNRLQVLENVALFLESIPGETPYIILNCLNTRIIEACAKRKVKTIQLANFPWSPKAMKKISAIPSLTKIYIDLGTQRLRMENVRKGVRLSSG